MNRRIHPQVALVGWLTDGYVGSGSPDAVLLFPINTTALWMGVFFQLLIGYYRGIVRGGVVGGGRHAVGLHTKFSGGNGMDRVHRSLLSCRLHTDGRDKLVAAGSSGVVLWVSVAYRCPGSIPPPREHN